MFLEVSVAILVVATAMVAASQLLAVAAKQQRALDRRVLATREAANLMEHVMARPWNELTEERVASLSLSSEAKRRLPGCQATIKVTTDEQALKAKQVVVQIDWLDGAGQRVQGVQLAAWKFQLKVERTP
jgi:hypothetical protein